METVRELIKKNILKKTNLNESIIDLALDNWEKKEIEKVNIFDEYFIKKFLRYNIRTIKDLFDLNIEQLKKDVKSTDSETKYYIRILSEKISEPLENYMSKKYILEKGKDAHIYLKNLIEAIKKQPLTFDILKREIVYREKYNDLDKKEKSKTKPFLHTKLNLNNYEINILKKYLLNTIDSKSIEEDKGLEEEYQAIINIYNCLSLFIKKIKYKAIIDSNYHDFANLNITPTDKRTLNKCNIFQVTDLIEYKDFDFTKIPGLGETTKKRIQDALKEKNIVASNNINEINIFLKNENLERKIVK